MRALVYDGALKLVTDRPLPAVPVDEALIQVRLAGICNTDLEITRGYMAFQGVLGHEFVGVVSHVAAPGDRGWEQRARIGQRVVGEINCACGTCPTCRANASVRLGGETHCPHRTTLGIAGRDGALADYCALPLRNLHPVPDQVSDEQAVFVEPLAAALEITDRIHVRPTDEAIVIGDGKLGLLVAQVLRLTGCALQAIGRHPEKLSILKKRGIATCMDGEIPPGLQADIVVDCTGNPGGFALARRLVRPRGRLVLKSTFHGDNQVNLTSLVVDELTLIGSRCGPFAPALRLIQAGLVDVTSLIEATYPLDEGVAAFERARRKGALKVLIRP